MELASFRKNRPVPVAFPASTEGNCNRPIGFVYARCRLSTKLASYCHEAAEQQPGRAAHALRLSGRRRSAFSTITAICPSVIDHSQLPEIFLTYPNSLNSMELTKISLLS